MNFSDLLIGFSLWAGAYLILTGRWTMKLFNTLLLFAAIACVLALVSACGPRPPVAQPRDVAGQVQPTMPHRYGPDAFGVTCYSLGGHTLSCVQVQNATAGANAK